MISFEHDTLRLFGIPLFTLIVGSVLLAALVGLFYGVFRWNRRSAKIALIVSALVLLLFALALVLVLVTVGSGSMG